MDAVLRPIGFWFLRHGQTDWNAQNLSQGNLEIPLNAHGMEQARSAASLLVGRGIATIVSSPLERARITADTVAAALGMPVSIDPELHETSFGVMEKQPIAGAWFTAWIEGRETPEGAESFAALKARVVAAIDRALDNPPLVLVVAHGAFFRALRAAMGLEPNLRLANATPIWCEPPADGEAAWTLHPLEAAAFLPTP